MTRRVLFPAERRRLNIALDTEVFDRLEKLAIHGRTTLTAVVSRLVLEEARRLQIGAAPKKRANAAARVFIPPTIYRHATGPIYVSWVGLSRRGYLLPDSKRPGHIDRGRYTDRQIDAWAARNPVGQPEDWQPYRVWCRQDPETGEVFPLVPDPDKP